MSANQSINRRLDTLSLTAMLVSAHYGLGFLLGTGEKTFYQLPVTSYQLLLLTYYIF